MKNGISTTESTTNKTQILKSFLLKDNKKKLFHSKLII